MRLGTLFEHINFLLQNRSRIAKVLEMAQFVMIYRSADLKTQKLGAIPPEGGA